MLKKRAFKRAPIQYSRLFRAEQAANRGTTDCTRKPIVGNCRDFGFGELISNGATIPAPAVFIPFITPMRCRVNFVPPRVQYAANLCSGEEQKNERFSPKIHRGENIRVQGVGNYYLFFFAFMKLNRDSIEYFFFIPLLIRIDGSN